MHQNSKNQNVFARALTHTRELLNAQNLLGGTVTSETHAGNIRKIIMGFSGGPDSLFLMLVLKALHHTGEISLIAVHVNYGWRDTALRDEQFCRDWCTAHDITLIVKHARDITLPPHKQNTGSWEADARAIRRAVFAQTLEETDAHAIALAHHQDDQLETFFIRLMRGTSLDGLSCMKAYNAPYLRPLLNFSKQDILKYLEHTNHLYCHDETNDSHDFLRNRIRHLLVPALRACDRRSEANILRTIEHIQETKEYLERLTEQAYCIIFGTAQSTHGSLAMLYTCHKELIGRVLLQWLCTAGMPFTPTERFFAEIDRFLRSPSKNATHTIAPCWRMWKKNGTFGIEHSMP